MLLLPLSTFRTSAQPAVQRDVEEGARPGTTGTPASVEAFARVIDEERVLQ